MEMEGMRVSESGNEDRTFCRRVRSSIYQPSNAGRSRKRDAFDAIPSQFRSSLAVVTLLGEKFLTNGTTCRKLPERDCTECTVSPEITSGTSDRNFAF